MYVICGAPLPMRVQLRTWTLAVDSFSVHNSAFVRACMRSVMGPLHATEASRSLLMGRPDASTEGRIAMLHNEILPAQELIHGRAFPSSPSARQAEDLADALGRRLRGEVRFDAGSRALYATDLSIYRQAPIGVVIPRSIEDVLITVEECRQRGVPILGRGCGTSLAGQTCNVAVVIDFSKYLNRLLSVDADGRSARVEPGIIRDDLDRAAKPHHLTFAPDP